MYYGRAKRTHIRPLVLHIATACLLFFSLAHAAVAYQPAQTPAASAPVRLAPADIVSHTPAAAAPAASSHPVQPAVPPAAPVVNAIQTVPACVANKAYTLPSALDLSAAGTGVTEVIDQPAYYQVFGTSVGQVAAELNACAPHFAGTVANANYLAYTSYHLSWQYSYVQVPNGLCSLADVKIGMHVSQIFPQWNSSAIAPASIKSKWQAFSAALHTHENGHVVLNTQYANKLLADLQSLPPMDCAAVSATVNATVNADVAALNAAHLQHDESTGYGATEGAVW